MFTILMLMFLLIGDSISRTSTIKLDSVTSDGIRMFDSELDVDVYDMLTSFPIESLSETFTEYLGVDVLFQTPFFLLHMIQVD